MMNLQLNWDLHIDDSVLKVLKKFPSKDKEAILSAIKILSTNPYFGDLQKMQDEEDSWRKRVGSYRIFFKIKVEQKIVLVFQVKRRTSNTY